MAYSRDAARPRGMNRSVVLLLVPLTRWTAALSAGGATVITLTAVPGSGHGRDVGRRLGLAWRSGTPRGLAVRSAARGLAVVQSWVFNGQNSE